MKIVVPLAGIDPRFEKLGIYKPLAPINGNFLLHFCTIRYIDSLKSHTSKLIFVILEEHDKQFNVSSKLKSLYGNNIYIYRLNSPTEGAACTVLKVKEEINSAEDVLVFLGDVYFEANIQKAIHACKAKGLSGFIPCFPSLDSKFSYVSIDRNGFIIEVAEKKPISFYATAGFYYFAHGSDFVKSAEDMIKKNLRVNGVFYIAPVYNELIKNGKRVLMQPAKFHFNFGSPADIENFKRKTGVPHPSYRSKIYAHRGFFDEKKPENSIQALKSAIDMGFSVELDLHKTADGVLIMSHDSDLERPFNRRGIIESKKYDELRNLDYFTKNCRIGTFDEFLDIFKNSASFYSKIAIHPKNYDEAMGDIILQSVLARTLCEKVFIFDLSLKHAVQLKEKYPFVRLGASIVDYEIKKDLNKDNHFCINEIDQLSVFDILWIDEWRELYNEDFLRRVISSGKEIIAVSPELHYVDGNRKDIKETWNLLIRSGCDQLCTDRPFELDAVLAGLYEKNKGGPI